MPNDSDRPRERNCPRCTTRLSPDRFDGEQEGTVTWRWKCECGWAGVLTESGVIGRESVRRELKRRNTPT